MGDQEGHQQVWSGTFQVEFKRQAAYDECGVAGAVQLFYPLGDWRIMNENITSVTTVLYC